MFGEGLVGFALRLALGTILLGEAALLVLDHSGLRRVVADRILGGRRGQGALRWIVMPTLVVLAVVFAGFGALMFARAVQHTP
jgi:hypothetical protein